MVGFFFFPPWFPAFTSLFLNQLTFSESRSHGRLSISCSQVSPGFRACFPTHLLEQHKLILCSCPPVDFFLVPVGIPGLSQLIQLPEKHHLPREDPERGALCLSEGTGAEGLWSPEPEGLARQGRLPRGGDVVTKFGRRRLSKMRKKHVEQMSCGKSQRKQEATSSLKI